MTGARFAPDGNTVVSKHELEAELQLARRAQVAAGGARRGDFAEVGRGDRTIRLGKVGVVEQTRSRDHSVGGGGSDAARAPARFEAAKDFGGKVLLHELLAMRLRRQVGAAPGRSSFAFAQGLLGTQPTSKFNELTRAQDRDSLEPPEPL